MLYHFLVIERIVKEIAGREAAMLDRIAQLVDVNSYTENRAGGNAVGSLLAGDLEAIRGISVEIVPSDRFADHLVATNERFRAEGGVAIVGHLDTVFPPGTFEGFAREGGIARGPGVLDMKGGLVVAIEAIGAVLAHTDAPVCIVIAADEEVGSPEGAGVIRRACALASCALVLEAGRAEDRIITRRKGTGAVNAIARGKAAHAGNGHKEGRNAIWALAKFIDRAQALTDYDRGVTVNVGKVAGGHTKNTVPDHAEAWLDLRFERVADSDALRAAIDVAAREAAAAVPGTSITIEPGAGRLPLERTDASAALMREYGACAKAAGLGDAEAALIGGGSDASTTGAMGIPSIDGLGPRGSGFHTKDELIEIATLVPKCEAIARFLLTRGSRT